MPLKAPAPLLVSLKFPSYLLLGPRAPSPAVMGKHEQISKDQIVDELPEIITGALTGFLLESEFRASARCGRAHPRSQYAYPAELSWMTLIKDKHQAELRDAGWHSRGYLPHYDGRVIPQFISLHLADSVPKTVIDAWKRELNTRDSAQDKMLLTARVEKYADQGYGKAFLKDHRVAEMVQRTLLNDDGMKYRLLAWVVMPNHTHFLVTRFLSYILADIMQSFKSITSHKANKVLERRGQFWMLDYFDRWIRNAKHFQKTVEYIENNPVKAGLCARPEDWPYSSAWFRAH